MAKLKIKNLRKVKTAIRKKVTKALRDPEIRKGVAEVVVKDIRETKIPVTSAATKAWRRYLEKGNTTSDDYSRSSINFTFTGALLDDLLKNVKARFKKGLAEIVLEHSSKFHLKYRKPNGQRVKGKRVTFKKIYEYLVKMNPKYDYLKVSNKAQKEATNGS